MKLTKKLKAEILKVYNAYWDGYLKGDVKGMAPLLAEEYTQVGSAETEVFDSKRGAVKFLRDTIDQVAGKLEMRNRSTRIEPQGDLVLVHEFCDVYVLADGKWMFYSKFRASTLVQKRRSGWKIIHQHSSFPDARTGEGENIATQKIAAENQQLREAVKRRTVELEQKARELEIETALERVRAIAMGMKEPADMLEVCKTISLQLQSLGVEEIRNVQTAIFYESRGTYMNYEYYAKHKKTIITETNYTNHKVHEAFATKMLKGKGEIFITHIKGKKVKDWIAYQKTTNVFIDRFLERASSLNYYWHSLGPVALGISTYVPLSKEELSLFNRFLNVFELAYTRYLDIELTRAQAREAQIETSLEKVRAQALGMRKPEELPDVCEVLFKELQALGFSELRNTMVNIHNDEKRTFLNYDYSDEIDRSITPLSYDIHPVIEKQIKKIRSARDAFSETSFTGKELQEWKEFRRSRGERDDPRIENISGLYYYLYSIGTGSIGISTFSPIEETKRALLKRFRNVFELAYRRYLDIEQAEAQAREAKIEASLERVRARTMAMHKGDELQEVITLVFRQLHELGLDITSAHININDKEGKQLNLWIANEQNAYVRLMRVPRFDNPISNLYINAVKNGEPFFTGVFDRKVVRHFFKKMLSSPDFHGISEKRRKYLMSINGYSISGAVNTHTSVAINNYGSRQFSDEENDIVTRFGKVFEQTYIRFLDLRQAEAQAREAKIQTALERVRAAAMSMHTSDNLKQVGETIFSELKGLGFADIRNTEILINNDSRESILSHYYSDYGVSGTIEVFYNDHPVVKRWANEMKKGSNAFAEVVISPKEMKAWRKYREEIGYQPDSKLNKAKSVWYYSYSTGLGALSVSSFSPITEEQRQILERFRNVFGLAYRRYADVAQAEAHARESQIELALERVRARSMAMHKSEELVEAADVVFQQLNELGIQSIRAGIATFDAVKETITVWSRAHAGSTKKILGVVPRKSHPFFVGCFDAWKAREKFYSMKFVGTEVGKYYRHMSSILSYPASKTYNPKEVFYTFFFPEGSVNVIRNEELTDDELDIMQRFARVFGLMYRRFLELQRAEAQAREAQIETALERVRSRTMGMQKSDELKEVIQVVYEQFVHLNIKVEHTGFVIDYKRRDDYDIWIADPLGVPSQVTVPYFDSVYYNRFNEAKEKGEDFFATNLSFEEKNRFYQKLFEYVPGLSEEAKDFYFSCPGLAASTVLLENVGLYIENFSRIPYTDEENNTLMRFGKVFQQTYTRFLDLQKAEAQAREAQIETALERVRARTMAMQRSDELSETAAVLFQEFKKLGEEELLQITIGIYNEMEGLIEFRVTSWAGGGEQINRAFNLSIEEPTLLRPVFNAWKEQKKSIVVDLTGKELEGWLNYRNKITGVTVRSEDTRGRRVVSVAFFSRGHISFSSPEPRPPEIVQLLERFAGVFDGTYTRFLDLQKAEAQAREAQIETALERVRARTMAMQRSDELSDASFVLFQQLKILGEVAEQLSISIYDEDAGVLELYATIYGNQWNESGRIPFNKHEVHRKVYAAWKKQEKSIIIDLHGEELQSFNRFKMQTSTQYKSDAELPKDRWVMHTAFFSKGSLTFSTYEPRPHETVELLERFAAVFDLTYTRFLDLKRAETQAREATIEASLEKVRGKAMAMHSSDDISETMGVVFSELPKLGISSLRCGVALLSRDSRHVIFYAAANALEGDSLTLIGTGEMAGHSEFENQYGHWLKQQNYFVTLSNEALRSYYEALTARLSAPYTPREHHEQTEHGYYFPFSAGNFYAWSEKPYSESEIDILNRFKAIIDLTFRRYLDLTKAEAQAREAQIEAALERVRSKTMAMHNSEEVGDTVVTMFDELLKLGIKPFRCGIGIFHEEYQLEAWTARPDANGKTVLVIGRLDMSRHPLLSGAYNGWKNKESSFTYELKGDAVLQYFTVINNQLRYPVKYDLSSLPSLIFHHDFYFAEGTLYVFTLEAMSSETTLIFKRFAAVFGQTYRRYLDLQKAEAQAREAQIEASLERVRSRTLAMQKSDELAETAAVLFKQLITLGIEPNRLYIAIIKDDSGNVEFWITDEDGSKVSSAFTANLLSNRSWKKMFDGWKGGQKSITIDMQGEELQEYFRHLSSLHVPFKGGLTQKRRVQNVAYFSKGFIGIASPHEQPEETSTLLERFAAVFNLTFTRFNDLKLAEAQAHQAHLDLIQLQAEKKRAEDALSELSATQAQLVQQEKLASLGQLTAGIAHEIKNPLNFVNNFSSLSVELVDEVMDEITKAAPALGSGEVPHLLKDIKTNLTKIIEHGSRADGIVKSMLQHSRGGSSRMEPTDLNALIKEYVNLAFHGMRASKNPMNVDIELDCDKDVGNVSLKAEDFSRVILNLCQNAFDAMREKLNSGGERQGSGSYLPKLTVRTRLENNRIAILIEDNGTGIPDAIKDKVLQPFFTTKKGTQGTGLGLSITNDIVKAHGGEMKIDTNGNGGATFNISLPTEIQRN